MNAVTLTEKFLGHVFAGEMDQALAMVAPDAHLIGSRPEPSSDNPIFGTHIGPNGARAFFTAFGEVIEPGEFNITDKFGTDTQACLYGQFRHKVRATGRPFPSDWALVTQVSSGKLVLYHFYEDTAALAEAMQPA
ncbi:nuclear transport factor 2 family protein [Paracoccus sp. (in: a-proteobacteria)]|uniref:nuclear transport factor 2 family protein n=1 Tax=Paracoccus sp. TaxID=267 RepID=UPI003A89ACF9